jgi:hypothetical protein
MLLALLLVMQANVAEAAPPEHEGWIAGVVTDAATDKPLADTPVVLRCECLDGELMTVTNQRGIYMFAQLPAGDYVVEVITEETFDTKAIELPQGERRRANFSVGTDVERELVVVAKSATYQCTYWSYGCVCGPAWQGNRGTFELGRSLFDDGGWQSLDGGPRVTRWLH